MPNLRAAPALLAFAVAIPAAPAAAQGAPVPPAQSGDSIIALRQEVERLTQELKRKQAELDAALERIKALESRAAGAPGAPAAPDAPAAPVPAPVPADPAIGPGGLLAAFQAEYLAAFRDVPDGSDTQKLNLHLRALEAWCAKGNRDALKRHTWMGQIDASTFTVGGRNCSFAAVFRNGTREFRYPVTVDQGMLARVRDRSGAPMAGDLAFDVVVRPRLTVNANRAARGAFENPPMVAPYVEYLLDLEPRSILPPATEPAK